LIDPDPNLREAALEELQSLEGFQEQPLIIYLLTTRLMDPDLDIRFHAVQVLGGLLNGDSSQGEMSDQCLRALTTFTTQIDKSQLVKLMEVSVAYLAAEEAIVNILRLCSYAGKVLGGIVNDRKLPVEIRQQAIFYAGEVGFLSAKGAIRNLVQRIRKSKSKLGLIPLRKKYLDEETLLPFAEAALGKLEGS
jgi:HEAT repeat protein